MNKKSFKILLMIAGLVFLFNFLLNCNAEPDKQEHAWDDCDITSHSMANITDPTMDLDPTQDQVIINFKHDISQSRILAIGSEVGLDLRPTSYKGAIHTTYEADVPEGSVPRIKTHLRNHGYSQYIESVEENFHLHTMAWEPDDPLYQYQWNFQQVEAVEAWTMATGRGVIVAVLDTGIALDENIERDIIPVTDLKDTARVTGYDFVDKDTFAWDGHGHGTHVAGTIAQSTHNSYGTSGLAYESVLMPVRVLNSRGSGTAAQVADGIRFAADNGAHIINMSLGSSRSSPVIKAAVEYASAKNVTIVAAAGNSGNREPGYPAAYEDVIAVASTQFDKDTAFYSQYGDFVTIAAPGGNTQVDQNGDGRPDGIVQETVKQGEPDQHYFGMFMGTSMASPHVAAVAALVQQWGVTHPEAVERILTKTTDTSPRRETGKTLEGDEPDEDEGLYDSKEFEERYGAGIVQADAAVTSAILDPGLLRLFLALILAAFVFFVARGQSFLEADIKKVALFVGTATIVSSGLFLLPFITPFMEIGLVSSLVQILSTPLARMEWVFLGIGQTPLSASFLFPLALIAMLYGFKTLKYAAVGVAIGVAAFCVAEMIMLTMPLMWIPGGDLAARTFYLVMAVANLSLGYLALRKPLDGSKDE